MPATMTAWENALTAMEDELDTQEEAVRSGSTTVVPTFEPPTDLGPLPAALADRATHLVQRIRLLTTFVEHQLTATENDLKHLERQQAKGARRSDPGISLYLDSSV